MAEVGEDDAQPDTGATPVDTLAALAPELDGSAEPAEPGRIESIDVLRGFALLGILLINIRFFALPLLAWNDPVQWWHTPWVGDIVAWAIGQWLFEHEMIALFSALFGAGIWMMSQRNPRAGRLHYRRMFWLLVIGHAHAFLLWYGDILMAYAVCGALVYPIRNLAPRKIIALGVLVLCVAPGLRAASGFAKNAEPAPIAASSEPASTGERWQDLARREVPARRAGYVQTLRWRAEVNVLWHYLGFHRFTGWLAAGFMFLGIGLLRTGWLDGSRSAIEYRRLALAGYGIGLPVVAAGVYPQLVAGTTFDLLPSAVPTALQYPLRYLGGAAVAMGHLGAIHMLYRAAPARGAWRLLAKVGRVSLSAYLLQSVICAVLFDHWGFGLWGRLGHAGLAAFVAGIWIVELALCSIWLRFFRLGPVEWLWRSLSYGAPEPMLVSGTISR